MQLVPGTNFTLDEAIDWLEFCCNEYYKFGASPVSDTEYNYIVECVRAIVPNHAFFTQKIRNVAAQKKIKLRSRIYPLARIEAVQDPLTGAFDVDATFCKLATWLASIADTQLYCSPKALGLTVILYYEHGRLVTGVTRGDGIEGHDITQYIPCIRGIPLRLPLSQNIEIRGTILYRNSRFQELKSMNRPGTQNRMNMQSLAMGTIALDNLELVAARKLDFYGWNVLLENRPFTLDEHEKFEQMRKWGFHAIDELGLVSSNNIADIKAYYLYLNSVKNATPNSSNKFTEDVAINGIVLTVDAAQRQKQLGFKATIPAFTVALNFPTEVAETIVQDIKWQVSRTGFIVPEIIVAPVRLDDIVVDSITGERCCRIIADKIGQNCKIIISRMGATKPKLLSIVCHAPVFNANLPILCPSCGQVLVTNTSALQCNNIHCSAQILVKLRYFFDLTMAVKFGASTTLVDLLFKHGLIKNVADFYFLSKDDLLSIYGIGESKAALFLRCVEASKSMSLTCLLRALSIPGIGATGAKKIASFLEHNTELLFEPTMLAFNMAYELLEKQNIPTNLITNFCIWIAMPKNQKTLRRLLSGGITILQSKKPYVCGNVRICLAGKTAIPHDELERTLQQSGYIVDNKITQNTDFLVCNANDDNHKIRKAEEWGIAIITENEILARLKQDIKAPATTYAQEVYNLLQRRAQDPHVLWARAVQVAKAVEVHKLAKPRIANHIAPKSFR